MYPLTEAQNMIEQLIKANAAKLKAYPRSASGLTLESAKDEEWHILKATGANLFANLQAFNKANIKGLNKERKAMRATRA